MQSYHFIVNMIPKSKLFIIHQYNIHIGIWILSYALHISTIHSTVTVNNVQEIILKSLIINNFLENYSYNHSLFCFVFLPYCLYSYCCLQKKKYKYFRIPPKSTVLIPGWAESSSQSESSLPSLYLWSSK